MSASGKFPGESLVQFYNRRLREKGDDSKEWYVSEGGQLRLRDRYQRQSKMDWER